MTEEESSRSKVREPPPRMLFDLSHLYAVKPRLGVFA